MVTLFEGVLIADVVRFSAGDESYIKFFRQILLVFADQRTGIGFNVNVANRVGRGESQAG